MWYIFLIRLNHGLNDTLVPKNSSHIFVNSHCLNTKLFEDQVFLWYINLKHWTFFVLKLTTAPSSYQWTLNVQDMCKLICLRVCFALIQNIVLASLRGVKTLTIRVISDFEFSLSWKLTLIKLFFLMQKVSHFYQISWHLFPYH